MSTPSPTKPFTLGILGGGQLARMTAQAAFRLGVQVAILDKSAGSPAAQIAQHEFIGELSDTLLLRRFADAVDIITLENEFVPAGVLRLLESWGTPLFPTSHTLEQARDKLTQKQTLARHDLPLPRFAAINSLEDARQCGAQWGFPFVLKARTGGYDGYGNRTVRAADEIEAALRSLGHPERGVLAEAWVPFERELAVMVARGRGGEMRVYPVVETIQQEHICKVVLAPATVEADVARRAAALAAAAVEAVEGVGVVGVEMFLTAGGEVLLNEIAPRPHNSGHYTIEACVTSQFENHLRAVCGWPLGETAMVRPAAAMVNLLGKREGPSTLRDLPAALRHDGAHLHIYGKTQARVGRKLGHVTVLGETAPECLAVARAVDEAMTL
jgi:5-(carboxyamino)imidazole ribonucleotide synthase